MGMGARVNWTNEVSQISRSGSVGSVGPLGSVGSVEREREYLFSYTYGIPSQLSQIFLFRGLSLLNRQGRQLAGQKPGPQTRTFLAPESRKQRGSYAVAKSSDLSAVGGSQRK